jgi:CRP/FNR family transcriptional regulator, cyclic AMP receptor protein
MELDDIARVLKSVPLFANLEVSKLKLVAFASHRLTFDDQEIVFQTDDPADSAFLIESGEAEVFIEDEGKRVKVNHLYKDNVFGEMALFLRSGRSATVAAKGTLVAMEIDGDLFLKMVTENPDAALGVMTALSEKIASASEQIVKNA